MGNVRGLQGVGAMLGRPIWGRVLVAAVAGVVASFLIGLSHSWTPTLMMATAAGVILAALATTPARFPKPLEYTISLLIPGLIVGWLMKTFIDDLGDLFGIYVGPGYDDQALVIATSLGVAATGLLAYAFLFGVPTNEAAEA